ncbi:hypothetical protein FOZ61_004312, partial [Perkinsus olseni]
MAEEVEAVRVPRRTRGFKFHLLCGMLKPKQDCVSPIYPIDYRYGLNCVASLSSATSAANIRARLSYRESLLQELQEREKVATTQRDLEELHNKPVALKETSSMDEQPHKVPKMLKAQEESGRLHEDIHAKHLIGVLEERVSSLSRSLEKQKVALRKETVARKTAERKLAKVEGTLRSKDAELERRNKVLLDEKRLRVSSDTRLREVTKSLEQKEAELLEEQAARHAVEQDRAEGIKMRETTIEELRLRLVTK